jgi:hypothetical protein
MSDNDTRATVKVFWEELVLFKPFRLTKGLSRT